MTQEQIDEAIEMLDIKDAIEEDILRITQVLILPEPLPTPPKQTKESE